MKILKCYRCGKEVGEIRKGRIRRDTIILCGTCHKKLLLTNGKNREPFDFFSELMKVKGYA